jgi:transposase
VDVSKATLDARIGRDGAWQQFARSAAGIGELATFCRTYRVDLVVMEASGGYERLPFGLLWAAGLPVAIVNPRSVRRFAEATGVLEKTDRIDCGMVGWFAEATAVRPTPPASATQQRLTALVLRLRQLSDLRVRQNNQRRLVTDADVQQSFSAILAVIARQIRQLAQQIAAVIDADPLWSALDAALRQIKGVADRTVARLLADLPELGALTNKAVAKLAGLAPLARDSGLRQGKRKVRGGRESIRSILFVVARVVCRHSQDFGRFHDRLKAAGKPYKVIRIALARKLLVRLNAKARDVRQALTASA